MIKQQNEQPPKTIEHQKYHDIIRKYGSWLVAVPVLNQ